MQTVGDVVEGYLGSLPSESAQERSRYLRMSRLLQAFLRQRYRGEPVSALPASLIGAAAETWVDTLFSPESPVRGGLLGATFGLDAVHRACRHAGVAAGFPRRLLKQRITRQLHGTRAVFVTPPDCAMVVTPAAPRKPHLFLGGGVAVAVLLDRCHLSKERVEADQTVLRGWDDSFTIPCRIYCYKGGHGEAVLCEKGYPHSWPVEAKVPVEWFTQVTAMDDPAVLEPVASPIS